MATVANITIVSYYLDGLTVKNYVLKPTQKQIIVIVEVCFINGHYDLTVDATAQAELEYESIVFNQDFKTSANSSKISTIKNSTFLTILFIDTFKIVSRTTRDTTMSINPELILTTGKTAVTKTVT